MKRSALLTVLLALCLCLCLVLASCGGDAESTGNSPESQITNGSSDGSGENDGGNTTTHTHSYGEWETIKAATCLEKGEKQKACSCGDIVKEEIPETGHNFEGNVCTACGERDELGYVREGDKIYFGSYPQTAVADAELTTALNALAGDLPEAGNPGTWTDYGYYVSKAKREYMWYIDVEENGEKYRGVYFKDYRPYYIGDSSTSTFQDDNGYESGIVYWFKYEPIAWSILKEDSGKALLVCDLAIDAQAFQDNVYYDSSSGDSYAYGTKIYANSYAASTIRAWLNDSFYNTAFGEIEKSIISLTTVANGKESAGGSYNRFLCEDTEDNVFLPSVQEVEEWFSDNWQRVKYGTDYAKAQGILTNSGEENTGSVQWWLRSPHTKDSVGVRFVYTDGGLDKSFQYGTRYTYRGIIPALWIEL